MMTAYQTHIRVPYIKTEASIKKGDKKKRRQQLEGRIGAARGEEEERHEDSSARCEGGPCSSICSGFAHNPSRMAMALMFSVTCYLVTQIPHGSPGYLLLGYYWPCCPRYPDALMLFLIDGY